MYRLSHGEMPKKIPKVAVVIIGVNDLISFQAEADMLNEVDGIVGRCVRRAGTHSWWRLAKHGWRASLGVPPAA